MDNFRDFFLQAREFLNGIGIILFLLGTFDNYLLTRYGGKLNRGFTIWKQPIKDDEKLFLASLTTDIIDKRQFGLLIKKTQTSFINQRQGGFNSV